MNSVWKQLMVLKIGIFLKRPLTYTYLASCRNAHRTICSAMRKGCRGETRQCVARKPLLHSEKHLALISNNLTHKKEPLNGHPRSLHQVFSQTRFYSSSIFVSDRHAEISSGFEYDLDLEEQLSDTEQLKVNLQRRGLKVDVDQLIKDFKEYLKLEKEKARLEARREGIAGKIAEIVSQQKQSGTKTNEQVSLMKSLKEEGKDAKTSLKQLMVKYWDIEEKVMLVALSIPNNISPDVPDSLKVLEEHFEDRKPRSSVDHNEVLRNSDMVRLSNVGHKAYYLTGRLAVLEQELINYFSTRLRSHDIHQMAAPEMYKTPVVESGCIDVVDPASVYRLHNKLGTSDISDYNIDHMFLRGTSHLSFLAYFARMELACEDLPIKMFAVGRNYIPEDADRRSLPGLYGVLQSVKMYMSAVCSSGDSSAEVLDQFVHMLTQIYKHFELPFRLVLVPVTSLTAAEEKRIELQMWVPSLQQYLTMGAVSVCGDYSSRRLMIRASQNTANTSSKPVHMVHCEVTDITRMIALLLEYQLTDQTWDR